MTYVPQIIIGLGISAICAHDDPPFLHGSQGGVEAAGVAEDRAEALSQIQPIWEAQRLVVPAHPVHGRQRTSRTASTRSAREPGERGRPLPVAGRAAVVAELGEDSEFVPGYPPPSPSAP